MQSSKAKQCTMSVAMTICLCHGVPWAVWVSASPSHRHWLTMNLALYGTFPTVNNKKTEATAPWQADRGSNP